MTPVDYHKAKQMIWDLMDVGNRLEEVAGRPTNFTMDEKIRTLKDWRRVRDQALCLL